MPRSTPSDQRRMKATASKAYRMRVKKPQETDEARRLNDRANQVYAVDRPVHGWYRFVLSFPSHLVREYMHKFGVTDERRRHSPG